ncbi:facilitated trehalose transporter Tret1-like [Drosophila busckii]|uniref:facilitated trehalose transporter Tret1-like n=1 Tax=Drosophila busckii TaxID=30019 RepID=UPI0014330FF1|nr:facilitated trehalose transporter Tret1-like [Drosophila busckii]
MLTFIYGAAIAWLSASYLQLQSKNSRLLTGPLSKSELGWISAALAPGAFCGSICLTWLADKLGRKRCLQFLALPMLLSWLLIATARYPVQLCVSRFLAGCSGGTVFSVIPVYVTEIAENRLRSTLGTFLGLSCGLGVLIIYVLNYFFDYVHVAWFMCGLPVLFVCCFQRNPETAQYLVKADKAAAERSLCFYRGNCATDKELTQLCEPLQKVEIVYAAAKAPAKSKTRKAFFIGLGLVLTLELSGCIVMMSFAAIIFNKAGSHLPAMISAIIVSSIYLIGCYVAALFVERAGRKTMLLCSICGICVGEIMMASYYQLTAMGYDTHAFNWLPVAGFSLMAFTCACGATSVTYVILAEIMPPKLRVTLVRLEMSILFILASIIAFSFTYLSAYLGMGGLIFTFAAFSFIGAVFVLIFVPETKGKSIEDIQESL